MGCPPVALAGASSNMALPRTRKHARFDRWKQQFGMTKQRIPLYQQRRHNLGPPPASLTSVIRGVHRIKENERGGVLKLGRATHQINAAAGNSAHLRRLVLTRPQAPFTVGRAVFDNQCVVVSSAPQYGKSAHVALVPVLTS